MFPTSCDQKKKLPEIIHDQSIEIFQLEVPPGKDSEASELFWYRSIRTLAEKLEKISGKKITRKRLADSIQKIAKAQQEFNLLNQFRKGAPIILGTDVIAIANTFFFDDLEPWTNAMKRLNSELKEKISEKEYLHNKNIPSILLTGSPSVFPNFKIPVLIEQSGAVIVSDELCSSNRLLYDPVAVDEWQNYDMIPAIADRIFKTMYMSKPDTKQ